MTAEIAILNKSAVALASDSAVTISAGSKEEKIYFSADKLFELSRKNPVGIMIYNGMQFMQAPLHMLISEYRNNCRSFDKIEHAAADFLAYLNKWGQGAPDQVHDQALNGVLLPVINRMQEKITERFTQILQKNSPQTAIADMQAAYKEVVALFEGIYGSSPAAKFIGNTPRITAAREQKIRVIAAQLGVPDPALAERVVGICKHAVLREPLSPSRTGIVIAGFGSTEIFPTLVSCEIDGMLFGSLKYVQTNLIDIDRRRDRARVLPFAQKEMVERFLYGIDATIENSVTEYCANTVPTIKDEMLAHLNMSDAARKTLTDKARKAERAFLDDLQNKAFEQIRTQSRNAIEGMVEFMPKPELATMAEALVNLTSIKRRVSRGMETVGGPIDVAVISKSEGFVWVKRKHYFSGELNPRYLARVQSQTDTLKENDDGADTVSGVADQTRGTTRHKKARRTGLRGAPAGD